MISNKDFVDLLSLFNDHGVRYLIIGGYAFSHYTEPRATKDFDLFVSPDPQNAQNVYRALASFGAPLSGITPEDFTNSEQGFQIGQPPNRIDILTAIEGVSFEEAWAARCTAEDGNYISKELLIRNKLAIGRLRDLADVEDLKAADSAQKEVSPPPSKDTA